MIEMLTDAELARAERLDEPYARFDGSIYAGRRRIDLADAASFRVLGGRYAIDDHRVYYADDSYWRIVNSAMHYGGDQPCVVDRASFEVLGPGFARDRERVYWHNDVLCDVSPARFAPLSPHFGRDDQRAYYFYPGIHRSVFEDGCYRGVAPIVLSGADPRTLVVLGAECAKDAAHVYWHGARLAADAPSFEVLVDGFARSAAQVFFEGEPIEGADAASFAVLPGTGYARDATSVFEAHTSDHGSWVTRVDGADPRDFVPLGGPYTRRGGRVFVHDDVLEGADPASFVVLGSGYARDAHRAYAARPDPVLATGADAAAFAMLGDGFATTPAHVYLCGEPIAGADPATFRFVDARRGYVADARRAWIRIGEAGDALVELACGDPSTLVLAGGGIARTATAVFVDTRQVIGADPASFERISEVYARDRDHVFVLGTEPRVLPGADPASFALVDRGFAKDARNVYRDDGGDVTILPGADPASFVHLDYTFSKDRHRAYCVATPIAGADPDSFVAIQDGYARDRHRIYRCEADHAIVVDRVEPRPDDIPF